jgi:hypothetical protein
MLIQHKIAPVSSGEPELPFQTTPKRLDFLTMETHPKILIAFWYYLFLGETVGCELLGFAVDDVVGVGVGVGVDFCPIVCFMAFFARSSASPAHISPSATQYINGSFKKLRIPVTRSSTTVSVCGFAVRIFPTS